MTSSLDTAATRPRCSSTTQSGMPRSVSTSSRAAASRSTRSVVEPSEVHTRCPRQVLDLAHAAPDRHEQPLRRRHVGAGELDAALPVAGDGEVVDDDVDLAALKAAAAVGDVQHDELDLVRVAEDRPRDRVGDVDVRPRSSPVCGSR